MHKRSITFIAAGLLLLISGVRAEAASFKASIHGDLLNRFSPATCGSQLGDSYDNFCPSGACSCLQYDDVEKGRFAGNVLGKGKKGSVHLHITRDGGAGTGHSGKSGPGCNPVYGQMELAGTKDVETIYFAGSLCDPQGNHGQESMTGGWSINSSAHGIKAFGTLTGSFGFFKNTLFSMKLSGQTQ